MVRFSCFQTNIHFPKAKKEVQRSPESISKAIEDYSQNLNLKESGVPSNLDFKAFFDKASNSTTLHQVPSSSSLGGSCKSETMDANSTPKGTSSSSLDGSYKSETVPANFSPKAISSSSLDGSGKSEKTHGDSSPRIDMEACQKTYLRKSQSVGSALEREGRVPSDNSSEDEVDQGFSFSHSHEHNQARNLNSLGCHGMVKPFDNKDPVTVPHNHYGKSLARVSFQGNDEVVHAETFSSSDEDAGHEGRVNPLTHADDSGHSTPGIPPMISKAHSVPDFGILSPTSKEGSPSHIHVVHRSRSSQDLDTIDGTRKEVQSHEVHFHATEDEERDCSIFESINEKCQNPCTDGYESYSFMNSVKDQRISEIDKVDMMKEHGKEHSVQIWNDLPSKDFKIKRIEEWVSMIDLEENSLLNDPTEQSLSVDKVKKGSHVLGSATAAKLDSKSNHGMEAAKKYVSSLTATSTAAQLANLGLVIIPFLSAFVSLKVLNLSGNSIVRITAGALPRGLHALNLAKNSISTIEGLRGLTRLRVLDLSYNRLLRIGHGLASCSSLKELYLAGNKISEVEGLHRLLKLNVLDLRFNKISTAKCLGQLAANYSSLQVINLEGNPAQRNVGDEQLKKYLQGLLPHLVYFNKQPIKANSKDIADRSSRSVVTSHQFDRGLRPEHKLGRKGSLSSITSKTSKASTSSTHAHRSHAVHSPKLPKDLRGRLPPVGTKGTTHHRHHFLDLGSKLLSFKNDLSMRRSRSEGNLLGTGADL